MKTSTVGILLIGNELLSGKVADVNSHFLTRELFQMGITVKRIIVVPDEMDEIVSGVRELLEHADYVITSGGIGPTHDDITVEAVSTALDRPLELDPELETRAEKLFGAKLEPQHLKMATIPKGSTLVESEQTRWPALVVGRVFVFAGVPKILKRSFDATRHLFHGGVKNHVTTVFFNGNEWAIAPFLDEIVRSFPEVQLGSYPELDASDYRVKLTLESQNPEIVEHATTRLLSLLPEKDVVRTQRS